MSALAFTQSNGSGMVAFGDASGSDFAVADFLSAPDPDALKDGPL